jgi:hypothetical protein
MKGEAVVVSLTGIVRQERRGVEIICTRWAPARFRLVPRLHMPPVEKFLVPDRGIYVVDYGIGLSCRPARLHRD